MIESVPPRRTASIAVMRADRRSTPAVSIIFAATASGSSPVTVCMSLATGAPCASMPTASITASGPRPSVSSRSASATSSCSRASSTSTPRARARASRSGTRSTPITRFTPRWSATRHDMSPIGPSPSTASVEPPPFPFVTPAYSTACQAVGSTSDR